MKKTKSKNTTKRSTARKHRISESPSQADSESMRKKPGMGEDENLTPEDVNNAERNFRVDSSW